MHPIVPQPILDLHDDSFFVNVAPIKFNKIRDHRKSNIHWHLHPQIWYTISGEYYHTINNRRVLQTPGSLAVVAPYSIHSIDSSESDLENLDVISVLFPVDVFKRNLLPIFSISSNCIAFENFLLTAFLKLSGENKEKADTLFYDMLSDIGKPQDIYIKKIFNKLYSFFEICIKNMDAQQSAYKIHSSYENFLYIKNSVDFSVSNFSAGISIEDAKQSAIMSRRAFTEKFKTTTGQSYVEFLTNVRMRKALSALRYTNMSIMEIADYCGFSNAGHFISICTKLCSKTPTALREDLRKWDELYNDMLSNHALATKLLNLWY